MRLRTSFALRYGKVVRDKETAIAREGAARKAFNSPYRPFVLASTSIGQEGLDFHPWCHAIVHSNMPGNPVDLEHREGRVHRHEGHAVRRNVAAAYGEALVRAAMVGQDVWALMFGLAPEGRGDGESDLRPWWTFVGASPWSDGYRCSAYTEAAERLAWLTTEPVSRLAFGQPRHQDSVAAVVGTAEANAGM
ncbi:MAG: helicase-related protein [Myxococcota bacterium]